jgi:hypothetical protein
MLVEVQVHRMEPAKSAVHSGMRLLELVRMPLELVQMERSVESLPCGPQETRHEQE